MIFDYNNIDNQSSRETAQRAMRMGHNRNVSFSKTYTYLADQVDTLLSKHW